MKLIGCLCLIAMPLTITAGFAQPSTEPVPGLTIEAKMAPKRMLGIFPLAADDLELIFFISGPMTDFSAFLFQCEYIGKNSQKNGGAVMGWVSRNEFKTSADGRLIAQHRIMTIPGGGLTGAQCRVMDIRK